MYINEVLLYQFVHRKISTLTFETHHVFYFTLRSGQEMLSDNDAAVVSLYLINQKESSKSGTNEDHNIHTNNLITDLMLSESNDNKYFL